MKKKTKKKIWMYVIAGIVIISIILILSGKINLSTFFIAKEAVVGSSGASGGGIPIR